MTKRGKRRLVIFLCAAAVILVAAGIVRVKLHPPRPLHEQIADYMYHSRTDPKLEYLVEKYGDEFVATEYGSIQSTRFSDFYVNVEWYEEEKTYKDDYIVYLRKQELESILIPIAEPIFGKCKLFVISYGDCPSNYGKDTSALELLGASEEYPLVQVCVYTTKDANQRDEDMQKWTEALQERRYFVCANIDYLSSETYDKVEQKSYQYINGDDDYICRGSAFISPDNFKWRFGGWEEKND